MIRLLNCFIVIALLGAGVAEIRFCEAASFQQCLAPATSLQQAPSVKLLYRELREREKGVRSIRLLVFSRFDPAAQPQLLQIMAYHTTLHLCFTDDAAFQAFNPPPLTPQERQRIHNLARYKNPAGGLQKLVNKMELSPKEVVVVNEWSLEKRGAAGARLFVKTLWRYLFNAKRHALILSEMKQAPLKQIDEYLKKLPQELTSNINFLEALVRLYRERGLMGTAAGWANRAVELLPESTQAWSLQIATLARQGNFRRAYAQLQEARKKFGQRTNLDFLMLCLYNHFRKQTRAVFHETLKFSRGEIEDWLGLLEWAVEIFPKSRTVRYALVKALWQGGYPEEALKEAEDVRENFPDLFQKFSFQTLYLRILIDEAPYQGRRKNFEIANALFLKAIDVLNPLRRDHASSKQVRFLNALFWKAVKQYGSVLKRHVLLLIRDGKRNKALKLCQEAQEFLPQDPDFPRMARALRETGRRNLTPPNNGFVGLNAIEIAA